MEKSRIDRINELAALAKLRPLTEEEQAERETLRREYVEEWRRSTIAVLENTWVQTPDGKKRKLTDMKKKK